MYLVIKENEVIATSDNPIIHNWIKWIYTKVTEEQQIKINNWYKVDVIDGELIFIENEANLEKDKEDKIKIINRTFQDTIKQFTGWYSQAEIDTWKAKIEESEKVIAWGTSELLESLVIEWETTLELAEKIMSKASEYSQIYIHAEKIKREEIKKIKNL